MTRFSAGKSGRRHEGGPAHAGAGFSGWAKGPAGGTDGLPKGRRRRGGRRPYGAPAAEHPSLPDDEKGFPAGKPFAVVADQNRGFCPSMASATSRRAARLSWACSGVRLCRAKPAWTMT